jgi:hypothetical protein
VGPEKVVSVAHGLEKLGVVRDVVVEREYALEVARSVVLLDEMGKHL